MMRRALSHVSVSSYLTGTSAALRRATDAKTIRAPHTYEQFAAVTNLEYLETMMAQYATDKSSVDVSWWPLLENISSANPDQALIESFTRPAADQDHTSHLISDKERVDNMRLAWLVRSYENAGHFIAKLDPLELYDADLNPTIPACLEPSRFGFTSEDMERSFFVTFGGSYGQSFQKMVTGTQHKPMKLREIIGKLNMLHCRSIGFDFMSSGYHLRTWFREEILKSAEPLSVAERRDIYQDIVRACGFEAFLHKKYATHKRFGLDGAEALIPAMNAVIDESALGGVDSVTLGMPHRGRLNVLVNVCGKSVQTIFNEFAGMTPKAEATGTGDVKYHLGIEKEIKTRSGKNVFVNLLANPSHLEAVDPLVVGKTCARQLYTKDVTMDRNLPILLHGDAAFAGQGVCYEVMGMNDLENFHVGGTIHIVVNNQVGFTTDPIQSRSSPYCTDLSRVCDAPVLHVNGDDVDAVVKCARIAARFRKEFKRDIIIDLVCYRRYGHNETDVPQFTQPIMYQAISKHKVVVDKMASQLVADGVFSAEEAQLRKKEYEADLRQEFENAQNATGFVKVRTFEEANSTRYTNQLEMSSLKETGVSLNSLRSIGNMLTTVPDGFTPHPIVKRTIDARHKAITTGEGVEWCLAELLAFGASALEGVHVRVTGQDVERGTFTQRHATWTDFTNGSKYTALKHLATVQAPVVISNSSLSEYGVCGFEVGYSMENPKSLVMWEAQFGDFCNGAQIIFDQFLASGESKWIRQCGLCVSLPHGYSGAGPEHSSARMERFLQLSDDIDTVPLTFSTAANAAAMNESRIATGNWQVCYPSTPANYYHMLRRQTHREFRKPLVFFFSKARLRAPNVSRLDEMTTGTSFQPVLDSGKPGVVARKVVFCSGQIESLCADNRVKRQTASGNATAHDDVVFVTIEQIAPFPWEHVGAVVQKYVAANPSVEFVWLQEEPKNMGAYAFVRPRLQNLLRNLGVFSADKRLTYIGRSSAASPATGYGSIHKEEEDSIFNAVFS